AISSQQVVMILTALDFVISRQRLRPITNTHHLAASPNLEVRIKYFKALPLFPADAESTPSVLRSGLADSDWRVRAMAARACGLLRVSILGPPVLGGIGAGKTSAEGGHVARPL